MTVQGELNSTAQTIEYIAGIEGLGWPSDASDLSAGWQGTVFVSSDLNGTLATVLECTVRGGLTPPSAFADSVDPLTLDFKSGAIDFEIVNVGQWLDDNIAPRMDTEQSGAEGAGQLMVDLTYQSTTVDIDWTNPGGTTSPFAEGDTAWIGGREAILLGERAVEGAGYRYTDCVRGYLGTPRGPWDARAAWNGQHLWKADTTAYPRNPFWRGRRVAIYAHVPGEVRTNCVLFFRGRLTNMQRTGHGTVWRFGATADVFLGRRRRRDTAQYVTKELAPVGYGLGEGEYYHFDPDTTIKLGPAEEASSDGINQYAIYYMYRYRSVPGGAELPGVDETDPQAEVLPLNDIENGSGDINVDAMQTCVLIDDMLIRLLYRIPNPTAIEKTLWWTKAKWMTGEPAAQVSGSPRTPVERIPNIPIGSEVSILLDNIFDELGANRFTVNGTIRRNPVDFALCLMTSCDSEFWRGDAAAGGDADQVNFTAPGWTTDQWVGYALHCVEGTNKGLAATIIANDADTIQIDTEGLFAAPHVGNEYQIRNSIYDVLPWGWGLGIHNADIDLDAWEDLRDRFLPDAELGRFAMGAEPDTDYWDLLTEHVFKPYGVMPYIDRSTGKLSARFIFSLTVDAAFETVINVTDADLLPGSFESIDLLPRQPITRIVIKTGEADGVVKPVVDPYTIEIRAGDAEFTYDAAERDTLEISAGLNDRQHAGSLAALHQSRLRDLVKPCYETQVALRNRVMLQVQAGAVLSITSTAFGVRNPFTNEAGLSSVPARVLSSRARIDVDGETSVECRIQLLDPVESCRIAPACDCTEYPDNDTIGVDADVYVDEPSAYDVTDFALFAAGDVIEIRSKTGAFKDGPFVIASFGANAATDPTDANSAVINIDGPIAVAFAAGDYVTFFPWSNASTANMELYSALADATDEELGAGDSPKEYL